MTDVLAARFDLGARCATHERPLPGGDAPVDAIELAARMEIDPVAARRLVFRHGSRSLRIAERVHERSREAAIVCACGNRIETLSTQDEIHVEICSVCHPYYTGKQRLVDTAGRVERFKKKYTSKTKAG